METQKIKVGRERYKLYKMHKNREKISVKYTK